MKRVYGKDWTKYLKNTHSVRYAESALNQAGFRIKEVRLGSTPPLRMNARGMVEGTFFKAKEKPMEFLARYGVSPNEAIETGHDIYIVVEPFGAAPRSASTAPRHRRALRHGGPHDAQCRSGPLELAHQPLLMRVDRTFEVTEAAGPRRAAHEAALHAFAGRQVFHMDRESAFAQEGLECFGVRHIERLGMREEIDGQLEAVDAVDLHAVPDDAVGKHRKRIEG